jgi:hypothetical protein
LAVKLFDAEQNLSEAMLALKNKLSSAIDTKPVSQHNLLHISRASDDISDVIEVRNLGEFEVSLP